MKRSSTRILTTHTGSLPRPPELVNMLSRHDDGEISETQLFNARVASAAADVVTAQIDARIGVVNDGEADKVSYFSYVTDRLTGFSGSAPAAERIPHDMADFPGFLQSRPAAVSFEAANPRHEHEYTLWDEISLPAGKIILPGVIDSTSNFIEHPELVAQRIVRFPRRVGRERVIASSDRGFSSGAGLSVVDDAIAWANPGALAQGARLASDQLSGQPRQSNDQ